MKVNGAEMNSKMIYFSFEKEEVQITLLMVAPVTVIG